MYRQILIQNDQRDLQRIVWREDASESIRKYRLNTVTYGTGASAPFLAIRCLHQLAIENQDKYPENSDIIRNDFYVVDLLSGGEDVDTIRRLKNELTEILQSAGFQLHKWSTNEPTILNTSSEIKAQPKDDKIKTLGVCWNTTNDCLQCKTQAITKTQRVTKQSVLSTIAQVFDPLGLMGPTIIRAKIILQQLWQLKIRWEESLPLPLHTMWVQYQNQVNEINSISIPRRIIGDEPQTIELHGFCDASESAYGACIYMRSTNRSGEIVSRLLCAKSRVAPLKSITLPRLKLCGAVMLIRSTRKNAAASTFNQIRLCAILERFDHNLGLDRTSTWRITNFRRKQSCDYSTYSTRSTMDARPIQGQSSRYHLPRSNSTGTQGLAFMVDRTGMAE
ncbi:uncharacterized protein LOC120358582 [Solenopsis invicta]|uniref:uncharacterized protein LOC120358582 n=1 Tax=Solenopsis invicta TaxID=13686 RepID=UPI00193E4204|nr:uncharacterized protein LOC120358582 [Solenopsis invicta]